MRNNKFLRGLALALCLSLVLGLVPGGIFGANHVHAAEATTTAYTFSDYAVGTQYAEETHELDENFTLSIKDCHLNTQLRISPYRLPAMILVLLNGEVVRV